MNGNAYIRYEHNYIKKKRFSESKFRICKKSVTQGHSKKTKTNPTDPISQF